MKSGVSILGIFVADTAYLAPRMPTVGETITGSGFAVVVRAAKVPTRPLPRRVRVRRCLSFPRLAATHLAIWP